jgi:regulator of sigma E protease
MLLAWGDEYLPTSQVKYGIRVDSLAMEAGLRNGDRIISVDHQEVENFNKIPEKIILDDAKTIQVNRDGQVMDVNIPEDFVSKLIKQKKSPTFISVRIPFFVEKFTPKSSGKEAGIEIGDQIIGINDQSTPYFYDFYTELQTHKDQDVTVVLLRSNDTVRIVAKVPPEGKLGIYNKPLDDYFEFSKVKYSFGAAIPAGAVKAYKGVGNYLKQLKLLFNPKMKAYESVGGFITIGNIFPPTWDWYSFWSLTAFLSIMLAILNILPIPALDGGHVMFLLYEIITRRKPSDKFMETAQIVGMVILFALLIFANGNDIIKLFRK